MRAAVNAAAVRVALVLLATGAALFFAALTLATDTGMEATTSPVAVNAGAVNPGNLSANNSPALAADPTDPGRIVIVNRVDRPGYSCGLHLSSDSGRTWSDLDVPIPAGEQPKCYAPDVAFGADGTLFVAFVTLKGTGNRPHAVWLTSSRDGGRTLSTPRRVSGPLAFQVRLAVDPKDPDRVYVSWLQPTAVGLFLFPATGNRIVVARSDDGGSTWREPVAVSDARRARVLSPVPAVGPDGTVFVLFVDGGEDQLDYEGGHGGVGGPPYDGHFTLVLGRSRDGGATWEESVVDDRVRPARRFLAFLPPFPSLAVDGRTGRLYAAYEDARSGDADAHLWSLAPGASEWTGPERVNDTPVGDRSTQYLPQVAVASDGRLDVVYYDRRADARDRRNNVSVQSSFDAGRSFTPSAALADPGFDSGVGPGSETGLPDLGSRLGLVSTPAGPLAAWADTRAGTVGSGKQDIAFATAEADAGRSLTLLRYAGLVLLALGGAATVRRQ